MYNNKKILILGMARSGYEVAKLLSKYTDRILITDQKEQNIDHVKELQNLNVQYLVTSEPETLLDSSFDLVVKNPGINYKNKCVKKAKSLGIKVINEVEVAYNLIKDKAFIIAVTGSNGKTTTVTLIYELLKHANKKVHLGGNIGIPLSAIVPEIKKGDILVCEISSHQLQDLHEFKPNIAVMTNLSEVHLDFFETYQNYINHKKKIFKNQTKDDIAILNNDNSDVMNLVKEIKADKLYFSIKEKKDIYLDNNKIYYKNKPIISTDEIRIQGNHNYENIMASILAVKQLKVSDECIKEVLESFCGVEHRLEFVTKINNRSFYNDSKATNVKSTMIALNSIKTPTILLLGGLDRKHSFEPLIPYLNNVTHIICFGETKKRIKEFSDKQNIDCIIVDNIEEATKVAYNISNSGDTILLSPACASWDQFACFEDRGTKFKEVISEINAK